jgi:ATP-dependent helicase/nuclease subunit A
VSRPDATALGEADAAARRLAVSEFARPVAIEAGAGTGKTRALVSRLATWILGPGWEEAERALAESASVRDRSSDAAAVVAARVAEGAVAITFTEAAAAEMARRLGALLLEVAAERPARDLLPLPELLETVAPGELARRARALAAALARLRIQTIHGFCHALLAEHPFDARLHPAIEVDADGRRLAEAAREALVARLRARESTLLDLVASGVDPLQIHQAVVALVAAGARRDDLERPRYTAEECAAILDAVSASARRLLEMLEPLVAFSKKLRRPAQVAGALDRVAASAEASAVDPVTRLNRLRDELPDLAGVWSSAFAEWSRGKLNDTEQAHFGTEASAFRAATREAREQLAFLASADPSAFELARRAIAPLVEEARVRLRRAGTLTFDDLLEEAIALLAGNPALRRRVRRSIRQLLVDEFQDTDRRQCALLRWLALADTPAAEERPGLFVVGDPKQSIYAWRSADLAAYQGFLAELLDAGGEFGRLAINFRSAPPILAEVERSVSPAMRFADRLQPAFEPLLPSEAHRDSPGFALHERGAVEFWLSWDAEAVASGEAPRATRAAEIEAAAIAGDIAELGRRHGVRWGEFAILLRTRGHLEIYLDALRRAGVPYVVQNDRSYYRRREVIDVLALVSAVLDPGDDLARVAALRSPFVGVPDAAWLPLDGAGFPRALREIDGVDAEPLAAARAAIATAAATMPRDTDGVPGLAELAGWPAALDAAVEAIHRLRGEWGVLPPGLWLERLRTRFAVEPVAAARFLGRFGLANVERLFDELEAAFDEAADPLAALAALRVAVDDDLEAEEARPPESEIDAVSILTIHTAKGLEFGHVYVAQAHKEPRASAEESAAQLLRPAARSGDPGFGAAEVELFGRPSPGWRAASEAAEHAREAEIVRLLYVALTRARSRLVICGLWEPDAAKLPPARSFLALLAPRRPADLEALFRPGEIARLTDAALWRRLDRLASPPEAPESATTAMPAIAIAPEDRRRAAARQARPRFRSASSLAGVDAETLAELEGELETRPVARVPSAAGEIARARGVALHRALELAASGAANESAVRTAYLEARPGAGEAELQTLAGDLATLHGSALWRRLVELEGAVLARELPLVAPSSIARDAGDDAGPIDGYLGTLDLLYRDPSTGETVVADFKSDPLGDDVGAIAVRVERYRPQLTLYGRAVQCALALPAPPRLELWFLAADRVEVLTPTP